LAENYFCSQTKGIENNMIEKSKIVRQLLGLDDPPPRELTKNRRGVMVYGHKTAGEIQIFNNESWARNKKYYVPRKGCKSVMKQF
jgi:hypothetical protein